MQRPVNKWHYCDPSSPPDIFDLAAAYSFGIISNHAFHDGNKRAGGAAATLFLRANDVELDIIQHDLAEVLVSLAVGCVSEGALAEWFRCHAVRGV